MFACIWCYQGIVNSTDVEMRCKNATVASRTVFCRMVFWKLPCILCDNDALMLNLQDVLTNLIVRSKQLKHKLFSVPQSSVLDDAAADTKELEKGEGPELCPALSSEPRDGAASSHSVTLETERADCPSSSKCHCATVIVTVTPLWAWMLFPGLKVDSCVVICFFSHQASHLILSHTSGITASKELP